MAKIATPNPKDIDLEFIINWCKANNQVEWLKKENNKQQQVKRYPRKTIIDENGKKVSVVDKTQEPTIKWEQVSFLTLRNAFIDEFMPEIRPAKKAKKSFHDLIDEL